MPKILGIFAVVLIAGCAAKPVRKQAAVKPLQPIVMKEGRAASLCPDAGMGACLVTWKQAVNHCKGENAHLPTAREYVDNLQAMGIEVLEHDEVIGDPPKGYYVVDSRNEDGTLDAFFMNHDGYQRPYELTKFHKLWTASSPPSHPEYAHVFYDEWGGGGGEPKDHHKEARNAFQCIDN